MDERIREILGAIKKWTCGKREDKPLTHLRPNSGMGEGEGERKQKGGFKKGVGEKKDSTFSLNS